MKIDIAPEDMVALQNNIHFQGGYVSGIAGNTAPLPDPANFGQAMTRLGYAAGNRVRELDEKWGQHEN